MSAHATTRPFHGAGRVNVNTTYIAIHQGRKCHIKNTRFHRLVGGPTGDENLKSDLRVIWPELYFAVGRESRGSEFRASDR
jgi:hypothetical protein